MMSLVLVALAGLLILDVLLASFRDLDRVRRRRERDRDRAAMLRTIDRTGGPR